MVFRHRAEGEEEIVLAIIGKSMVKILFINTYFALYSSYSISDRMSPPVYPLVLVPALLQRQCKEGLDPTPPFGSMS